MGKKSFYIREGKAVYPLYFDTINLFGIKVKFHKVNDYGDTNKNRGEEINCQVYFLKELSIYW